MDNPRTMTAFDGEVLPIDNDGDPYRIIEGMGPLKMTPCCGAAATGTFDGIVCKRCFEPTFNDGPANLDGPPTFNDGPANLDGPPTLERPGAVVLNVATGETRPVPS